MALFNFFGRGEHRVFDHKPIYYDPEKDKLRRYFGDVDGSNESAEYKPGSYIRGSFRDSRTNGIRYEKSSINLHNLTWKPIQHICPRYYCS